jgi:hypothetical protein
MRTGRMGPDEAPTTARWSGSWRVQGRSIEQSEGRTDSVGRMTGTGGDNDAERGVGFHKGCLRARVVADTEKELGSLPMVLLTPVIAAVFATVIAVSEPAAHVVQDTVEAPGLAEALLYAAEGAAGGIILVILLVSLYEFVRYWFRGDSVWRASAEMNSPPPNMFFELVIRGPHPSSPATLGALECLVETPGGACYSSARHGQLLDRMNPSGKIWQLSATPEAGRFQARWYAVPDGKTLIEIARCTLDLLDGKVEAMADEVLFSRPNGSSVRIPYEGELLVADGATERVVVLDEHDEIVVLSAGVAPIVLNDEMQLSQHLPGPSYQIALGKLQDTRARRLEADSAGSGDD